MGSLIVIRSPIGCRLVHSKNFRIYSDERTLEKWRPTLHIILERLPLKEISLLEYLRSDFFYENDSEPLHISFRLSPFKASVISLTFLYYQCDVFGTLFNVETFENYYS